MPRFEASSNVYIAAGAALLGGICFGVAIGYSAPALETMLEKPGINSTNRIAKKGDESIIGSSIAIGALFGSLVAVPISQVAGRKRSLVIIGVPFAIGCGVIFIARSLTIVIVGRIIIGFFTGMICVVAPSYIVEISTPSTRGFLGAGFQVFVTIGIFLMAVLGIFATVTFNYFFNWRYLALVSAIPAIGMSILMLGMPESPHWLLAKYGRSSVKPEKALSRLRTPKSDIQGELDEMQDQVNQAKNLTCSIDLFKKPEYWKPCIFGIALFIFQQFSGINVILFFQTQILRDARGNDNATEEESATYAALGTAISTFVMIMATVCAAVLVDRVGRRKLLLVSGGGHVISLFVLGFYFYIKGPAKVQVNNTANFNNTTVTDEDEPTNLPVFIPILCLVIYIISFSLGYGPIPWLMLPEMTPTAVRSTIVAIALTVNWICVFISAFTFGPLIEAVGSATVFWSYAIICVFSCLFVLFFLPETKGKSFDEIQRDLTGKKKEPSIDSLSTHMKQTPEMTAMPALPDEPKISTDEQTPETADAPLIIESQMSPQNSSEEPPTAPQISPLEENAAEHTTELEMSPLQENAQQIKEQDTKQHVSPLDQTSALSIEPGSEEQIYLEENPKGKKEERSTDLISGQAKQSPEKTTEHVPPDEQTQETTTDAPPATEQQVSPLGKSTEQTVEPATGQQASPLEQNREQTTVPVIFAEPKESPGQHPTVSKDNK
ncbi:facilitated trehalose transporter Tret1-like protein [Leptotrombidium deliense]|uniref:Facilitated trehalose transporter Tret1-like protein n=1 Tax=Leptotrombidium deliense TaxID=299467 RepID=A0A443SUN6_9ACAR|nr:facilitated trehalose transporter Tret1-like protein [Leptotrombidium deliense]